MTTLTACQQAVLDDFARAAALSHSGSTYTCYHYMPKDDAVKMLVAAGWLEYTSGTSRARITDEGRQHASAVFPAAYGRPNQNSHASGRPVSSGNPIMRWQEMLDRVANGGYPTNLRRGE